MICRLNSVDNDTLKDFLELIEYSNDEYWTYIAERAKGGTDGDSIIVEGSQRLRRGGR